MSRFWKFTCAPVPLLYVMTVEGRKEEKKERKKEK